MAAIVRDLSLARCHSPCAERGPPPAAERIRSRIGAHPARCVGLVIGTDARSDRVANGLRRHLHTER